MPDFEKAVMWYSKTKKILDAIGSDIKVEKKYLEYGYGYGGPCLPRDNRALAVFA